MTATRTEAEEAIKQLLLRCWMTHDAMWFKAALDECGIDTANRLNRAAIRAMAPLEVKRILAALGMDGVANFDELRRFMTGAMDLLAGDFMEFDWDWRPPDALLIRVDACFAHKGITRLGAIDRYQCGIYDRIYRWFDVLGVTYEVTPAVEHCTMHHDGDCLRQIRFAF